MPLPSHRSPALPPRTPHSSPHPHTTAPWPTQVCPALSAWVHSSWALASTANPLPSCSGSPFPASVQDPGLHVWRVEKLKPVPVARENQGIFFSGDSYLVLHNGPEELSHLHLWIGKGAGGRVRGVAWPGVGHGSHGPGSATSHPPQASSHPGMSRGPVPC